MDFVIGSLLSIFTLVFFLTYLFDKGYAPSTMITYNSAISYVHKLNGLIDPANSVFIQKMLQGAKKTRVKIDNRLPITKSI
jgi:membrane-bound ClpP family serine protease